MAWVNFEKNLLAETALTVFAGKPPYRFYRVSASGTDGAPGPH
jgi:hypothetical protein